MINLRIDLATVHGAAPSRPLSHSICESRVTVGKYTELNEM